MSNVEEEVESQLSSAPPPKPKRKTLSTAERLRIIDDFRNGIPDRYYSVDLNPRKPGEYIVRKRKTPITYDIERPIERKRPVKPEPEPEADDAPTSKTPSQLLTEPKKAFIGTEFFSMQSSLNANLQRELDTLHEKFNKLDAKSRKERAARKAKNPSEGKPQWFIGGVTDENARTVEFSLDFLEPGRKYEAIIYADAKDADYRTNPTAYEISDRKVTSKTKLKLAMAPGGGFAVSIREID